MGAYGASALGTWVAFDAFPLVAIRVLDASPTQVSVLATAGLAAGAAVALPLGPWVEFRRKRPVMIAMDAIRFTALMTLPLAYALSALTFGHLVAVAVVMAAADITFTSASGAYLKGLVRREDLLVANGRFEATMWTTSVLGPPLGGVAVGLFGPIATVAANAASFLLSGAGLRAIHAKEPYPEREEKPAGLSVGDVLEGWRYILTHPALRPLFLNTVLNNGLLMASAPLLAVLMLGDLGFTAWQYGLALAVPCVGGLVGSRLAPVLVARSGQHRVLRTAGTLRACWPVGLAFVGPGTSGLVLVMAVELGLITCSGIFNPVYATYRLEHTAPDRVVRTLSAWSVTSKATIATLTGLWGLLAAATGPRLAIGAAGVLVLATPLLLPRHAPHPSRGNPGGPTLTDPVRPRRGTSG